MGKHEDTEQQIQRIAEALVSFGAGDFAARAPRGDNGSSADKLAFVVNLTVEEFAARLQESERQLAALNESKQQLLERQSELETANRQLADAHERMRHMGKLAAIGEISAMLAHELNQPLTAILGYASLLIAPPADDQEVPARLLDDLRIIHDGAQQLKRVVQNLTRFSRSGQASMELTEPIAPLDAAHALFAANLKKLGIRWTLRAASALPAVRMDSALVQQVFINLLSNARDAVLELPEGQRGEIEVEITPDQAGGVRYLFRDNGPGVPDENRARIFEPFFTTKPDGQGTGLGLSLSRDIIRRLGGELRLGRWPRGACFVVRLGRAGAAARAPRTDR